MLGNLAVVYNHQEKLPEAIVLLRESLDLQLGLFGARDASVAKTMRNLGFMLFRAEQFIESETMLRDALKMQKELLGIENREVIATSLDLGYLMMLKKETAEAEKIFREALVTEKKGLEAGDSLVIHIFRHLVGILLVQKKLSEADTLLEEYAAIFGSMRIGDPLRGQLASTLGSLLYDERGKPAAAAEPYLRDALQNCKNTPGSSKELLVTYTKLFVMLYSQRRLEEAETMLQECIGGVKDKEAAIAEVEWKLRSTAEKIFDKGRYEEAEHLLWKDLEIRRRKWNVVQNRPPANDFLSLNREQLGSFEISKDFNLGCGKVFVVLLSQGKRTEAEKLLQECLEEAKSKDAVLKELEAELRWTGESMARRGMYAEAEPLILRELESVRVLHANDSPECLAAASALARLWSDWAWNERNDSTTRGIRSSKVSKRARDAERWLRENLAARLRGPKVHMQQATIYVPSRLGGALVAVAATDSTLGAAAREAMLQEAEKLLLQSQGVMEQLEQDPKAQKVQPKFVKEGLIRLVRLYQLWDKPEKAEPFQKRIANIITNY